MWTPGAGVANGGGGEAGRETSISREPQNQTGEARSDLALTTTMFRALGHIVLWSTECADYYYSIVTVGKNLGLVEAQNSVPSCGHLGLREPVVQPATLDHRDP